MVDFVVNASLFIASLALIFGYIMLLATRPRIATIIFWIIAFPFAAFWAWGGWIITKDFGTAGYGMLVVGVLLLLLLSITFLQTVVYPGLRRLKRS